MRENCLKACSDCCMDYNEWWCGNYASLGRCTDTSQYYRFGITWQEYMRATCRVSCDTCDLDLTPSPTPPVICSDDQFKYEIIVKNNKYRYFDWGLYYKYPEQIDGYEKPERFENDYFYHYSIIDGYDGEFPPNYEKKFYGCASYSCFDLRVFGVYLKMYDYDKDILIGQTTESHEHLRFCHYTQQPTSLPTISALPSITPITPPLEAIFIVTLKFSTSASDKIEHVSAVVQRSVKKNLFRAQINDEGIVLNILDYSSCDDSTCDTSDSSCEEDSSTCDISVQVCEGSCGEGEDPEFLAFIGNTMSDTLVTDELLSTLKQTGHHMDVDIFNDLIDNNPINIEFDFEYVAWPTTSSTTSPSSTLPIIQDCDAPVIVQNLFGLVSNILQPVIQVITDTADPISDVLFGVEPYDSIATTTCKDKEFELQLEIKTDGSPDKTSWELLYENGTIIESIGQDTYSECDTVHKYSYCLDTSCFVFNMFDSFEFKGSYNITVGDTILAYGDSFLWWKESKRFCYPQCDDDNMFALQIELMTDNWPQETSWQLAFDNGTIVDHLEERYYTGRNTVYNHRYCLLGGCYDITFHDHIGDGMCCSYGSGSFNVKMNDNNIIREGGEFEESFRKSFCHMTTETSDEVNNSFLFGIITDLFGGDEICCTTDMTGYPTPYPTTISQPTISSIPSSNPSSKPSLQPTFQPSSQPSLQPTFATPPVSDYKVWLDEQSWSDDKWLDKSTYGHHCATHGTINKAVDVDSGMAYLYGDTTSGVTLTSGWPSGSEYTFFHVTKYNGPTKERIWSGTTGNWLSGHWENKRGVFYHEGWITQTSVSFGDADSWGIFTDRVNSSGSNVRVDGVDVTINSSPKFIPGGIGINNLYSWELEKSDWAVEMVLVYDRYLDEDEVLSVEDWIRSEYLSSKSQKASFNPTTTSKPSSWPTTQDHERRISN